MVEGRSGISLIERFPVDGWPVRIAGEVRDFDARERLGRKEARRSDRFVHFAMVAGDEAVRDAGLEPSQEDPHRFGIYVGSGIGGLEEIADSARILQQEGRRRVPALFIPRALVNLAAGQLAIRYGAMGPSLAPATACAAGNHAIGEAFRVIRDGTADVVLAGGAEAAVVPLALAGFISMRALSRRNDDPAGASRPFDRDRDGFVMSEGAGLVVLEEHDRARRRGARIYGEITGYGQNNDAWHLTAPSPEGAGARRCMAAALADARLSPHQVDYVNAHGTSTPPNDRVETLAIRGVFGAHARRLLVSSTKSVTGHLLGGAGGVEAIASLLALHEGVVPPTINLHHPDAACDLDYVPGEARPARLAVALSNAFGFGGTNACLVFERYSE